MKPKISIIIPCYNVEQYIMRCAKSLINQTLGIKKIELIFVNDASTDLTLSLLSEIEKEYMDSIIVINLSENGKQGTARNIGMQYARADYIGFIDSDDWIEPDMYEKLYSKIEEYNCDLVECGLVKHLPDGKIVATAEGEDVFLEVNTTESRKKLLLEDWGCSGGCCCKLYRKSLIVNNKILFPEHLAYEDNYWNAMINIYAKCGYALKENLYHYCIHEGSTVQGINSSHHLNRLDIELMKIDKYKEIGAFCTYYDEFEFNFLLMFYMNTLHILLLKFYPIPIKVIEFIQKTVLKLFPNYKNNQYVAGETSKYKDSVILLKTIELNWSEEQWDVFAGEYRKSYKILV